MNKKYLWLGVFMIISLGAQASFAGSKIFGNAEKEVWVEPATPPAPPPPPPPPPAPEASNTKVTNNVTNVTNIVIAEESTPFTRTISKLKEALVEAEGIKNKEFDADALKRELRKTINALEQFH